MSEHSSKDTQNAAKALTGSVVSGSSIFGVQLPQAFALPLRFGKGIVENFLSHGISEIFSERAYDKLLPSKDRATATIDQQKEAKEAALKAGSAVGSAIITAVKFIPTAIIGVNYFKAKRALSAKIDPVSRLLYPERNFFTFGHSENRVLQFASDQVHERHNAIFLSSVVSSTVGAVTQGYMDKQHQVQEQKKQAYEIDYNHHKKLGTEELRKWKDGLQSDNPYAAKTSDAGDMSKFLGGLAEAGGSELENWFTQRLPKVINDKTSALDMCLDFDKQIKDKLLSLDPLDQVRLEKEEKVMARDVSDIIKRVYVEAGWRNMPEIVSEEIENATRIIVRPMLEGRLEPLALVKLLGEDKIIRRDGTSLIEIDELKETLEELCKTLSPDKTRSIKDYFEQGGIDFRLEDVTNGWEHLSVSEKSLFALLLSDKVLIAAGAKKADIEEYNRKAESMHPSYEEQAALAMLSLAELPEDEKRKMFGKSGAAYVDNAAKRIQQAMKEGPEKQDAVIGHVARLSRTKNILATVLVRTEPNSFSEMIEAKRGELDEKVRDAEDGKQKASPKEQGKSGADDKLAPRHRATENEHDLRDMMERDSDERGDASEERHAPKADWSKLGTERKLALKDRGLPHGKSPLDHREKVGESRSRSGPYGGLE